MKALKIAKFVVAILIILFCILWIKSCKKEYTNNKTEATSTTTPNYSETLMFSGTTPCSPTFNYKFRIEADGPIWEKFPGIDQPIYWDGTSKQSVPDRESGAVDITSADPDNPNIQVRIYLVTN